MKQEEIRQIEFNRDGFDNSELLIIYKKYGKADDWYEVSSELFAMPEREFQYVAMAYLLKAKKSWDPRVPLLVHRWVDENSWWDVVDVLGPKVLGLYFAP